MKSYLHKHPRKSLKSYFSYQKHFPTRPAARTQVRVCVRSTIIPISKHHKVLRSKAYSLDVFRVSFSPELQGQLTTSGIGHIRFWQMAETFTGLKLQGQLGRFGKTSVSDIEGFVQLPDGKVVSGAEWGNILVWDGGLIKVEISREKGKPCHDRKRFPL